MNVFFMAHWFSLFLGLVLYILLIESDCFNFKVNSRFLYIKFFIVYIFCYAFSYGWFILIALWSGSL